MSGRLATLARGAFVWCGILLFGAIALVALVNLGLRLLGVIGHADDAPVLTGLLGVAAATGLVLGFLVAGWWLAGRGRFGFRVALVGGLLALAGIRIVIALLIDSHMDGEMSHFDAIARGMLAGECCFADRATGYPLLLAGAYALMGPGPAAAEALNLLLGLLSGVALAALLYVHAGERPAVLGLYLLAVWPAGALISNSRLSETFYISVLLIAVLTSLHGRGWRTAALTGGLLAAAQYIRPSTIALVPAFLVARLWPGSSMQAALRRTVVPLVAAGAVVLMPVVAYNLENHAELSVSTSAYGGWSLYIGTDQRSGGQFSDQAKAELEALTPGGVWEDSAAGGRIALERLASDPLGFAAVLPNKFHVLWGSEDFGVIYGLGRGILHESLTTFPMLASNVFYAVITSLSAVAVFRRRREFDSLTVLCVGLTLSVALIHVFVEVRDRYHAYLVPMFIALVAMDSTRWVARLDRLRLSRLAVA
jgi:hypothetical protein